MHIPRVRNSLGQSVFIKFEPYFLKVLIQFWIVRCLGQKEQRLDFIWSRTVHCETQEKCKQLTTPPKKVNIYFDHNFFANYCIPFSLGKNLKLDPQSFTMLTGCPSA